MLFHLPINREDRETELLLKLDDFEMRDHPNGRMISHFKKMIGITKNRAVVAKSRYDDLKKEYNELKSSGKKRNKVLKNDSSSSTMAGDDEEEDDEIIEVGNECNIELNFDGERSTTNRVETNLVRNASLIDSDTSTSEETDLN